MDHDAFSCDFFFRVLTDVQFAFVCDMEAEAVAEATFVFASVGEIFVEVAVRAEDVGSVWAFVSVY